MATLEKIRNKAGLLVSIVGLALFAFIIGDLLNSSSSFRRQNQSNVLVINGHTVDYQEYISRENEMTERYKLQLGMQNLSESYMTQIRQSVYEEFMLEKILDPRLNDLGIVITPQEMTDMVEGENISPILLQNRMFQNPETGQFDRYSINMFLNYIKNIDSNPESNQAQLLQYRAMWMFWEKDIKRTRLYEKYTTLLSKIVAVNSLDAQDAFNNSNVSSDIVYAMESFVNIPDSSIQVPASEIEKLYNERKEMFRQQETAVIDYIAVDITPSQQDFAQAADAMNDVRVELETTDNIAALVNEKSERKFINAFYSINGLDEQEVADFAKSATVGEIEGPVFKDNKYRILKLLDKMENADSVSVLIMTVQARPTEAETRAYADSILNELKKGADFVELVQKHSVDQMRENGGEIGWMTEASALQVINEEFRKTVFTLPVGQSEMVKSNHGFHIVKIKDRTKNVPKYKVADIVYTVTPSSATRSQLYNALNQYIGQNNNVEKIEETAQDNGYFLTVNARVLSTDAVIGSVSNARQVVRWAFNNKKGQISDIFECDNAFVVAIHKGKLPEGYQSLATVTPQLQLELANRKKGEEIIARLKAKRLSSIEDYAEEMKAIPDTVKFITMATSRIATIGIEPALNAHISFAPLNQLNEPVAGYNGVYVFEVFNRTSDMQPYDRDNQIRMLETNNSYRIGGYVFRHLQQQAKITDNRILFY